MSNSVFLPKNSDNQSIKDVLSATSAVPAWLNNADKNPKNLKKDIGNLLQEMQGGKKKGSKKSSKKGSKKTSKKMITDEQLGGAKKGSKKTSKKTSKKGSKSSKKLIEDIVGGAKKGSKKSSKKGSKKGSKKMSGGAYEVEMARSKVSKKGSKKGSKKSSKKMGRELPPAIVMGNKFKEHVQKDMNLKGGPVLMTFSYMIWNEFKGKNANASPDELFKGAMNLYNEYKKKGELQNMYKEAEKRFAEKKAAKKNKSE